MLFVDQSRGDRATASAARRGEAGGRWLKTPVPDLRGDDVATWRVAPVPRRSRKRRIEAPPRAAHQDPTLELDPVLLSRLQFAFVIAFHILLPAFTVGLSAFIVVARGAVPVENATRSTCACRCSGRSIFAVSFGMGVVSGIVMPFQFGTNWSRYSDTTANVLAPLFTYEVLVAFFLESGFLGILLFGRKLVPPWAHFLSAVMVAAGTLLSSFWILAANSWMQTPAGYEIIDGRFFR